MAVPTIRTEALTKRYKSGTFGARDITVNLDGGELIGLIGPNGAGKSTLINLLCGLKSPTSGSVEVRTAGGRFSWCPQKDLLDWSLTPYENILFGAAMAGLRGRMGAESARRSLEIMELAEVASQDVATLTGGQQRRVQIARALAMQPSVVILDEPASGLDPHGTVLLFEYLTKLAEGGTLVVVSSHDLQTIQEYARRLLLLGDGTLKYDGTVHRYLQAREAERGLRFTVEVERSPDTIMRTVLPLAAEHTVNDGTICGRLNPGVSAHQFLAGIHDIEGIVAVDLGRSDLREAYLDDTAGKR